MKDNKKIILKPPFPIWEIAILILMWIDKRRKAEDENGNSEKNEDL